MEVILGSGMCNRIISLASLMLASRDFHHPLRVYWPYEENICSMKASDLFDLGRFPKGVIVTDESAPDDSKGWPVYSYKQEIILKKNQEPLKGTVRSSVQPYKKNTREVLQMIRSLPYNRAVLDEIRRAFRGRHVVGVHIRRGDKKDMEKNAPLQTYIEVLKHLPKSFDFFVCSDDKESIERLKKEFGERVLTFAKTFDRSSRNGGKDAVRDLLGLSGTIGLVGSTDSSFSRVAADIGGLPWYDVGQDKIITPRM